VAAIWGNSGVVARVSRRRRDDPGCASFSTVTSADAFFSGVADDARILQGSAGCINPHILVATAGSEAAPAIAVVSRATTCAAGEPG